MGFGHDSGPKKGKGGKIKDDGIIPISDELDADETVDDEPTEPSDLDEDESLENMMEEEDKPLKGESYDDIDEF
jgi:hypothetical protein